jgi:hypothetical protein
MSTNNAHSGSTTAVYAADPAVYTANPDANPANSDVYAAAAASTVIIHGPNDQGNFHTYDPYFGVQSTYDPTTVGVANNDSGSRIIASILKQGFDNPWKLRGELKSADFNQIYEESIKKPHQQATFIPGNITRVVTFLGCGSDLITCEYLREHLFNVLNTVYLDNSGEKDEKKVNELLDNLFSNGGLMDRCAEIHSRTVLYALSGADNQFLELVSTLLDRVFTFCISMEKAESIRDLINSIYHSDATPKEDYHGVELLITVREFILDFIRSMGMGDSYGAISAMFDIDIKVGFNQTFFMSSLTGSTGPSIVDKLVKNNIICANFYRNHKEEKDAKAKDAAATEKWVEFFLQNTSPNKEDEMISDSNSNNNIMAVVMKRCTVNDCHLTRGKACPECVCARTHIIMCGCGKTTLYVQPQLTDVGDINLFNFTRHINLHPSNVCDPCFLPRGYRGNDEFANPTGNILVTIGAIAIVAKSDADLTNRKCSPFVERVISRISKKEYGEFVEKFIRSNKIVANAKKIRKFEIMLHLEFTALIVNWSNNTGPAMTLEEVKSGSFPAITRKLEELRGKCKKYKLDSIGDLITDNFWMLAKKKIADMEVKKAAQEARQAREADRNAWLVRQARRAAAAEVATVVTTVTEAEMAARRQASKARAELKTAQAARKNTAQVELHGIIRNIKLFGEVFPMTRVDIHHTMAELTVKLGELDTGREWTSDNETMLNQINDVKRILSAVDDRIVRPFNKISKDLGRIFGIKGLRNVCEDEVDLHQIAVDLHQIDRDRSDELLTQFLMGSSFAQKIGDGFRAEVDKAIQGMRMNDALDRLNMPAAPQIPASAAGGRPAAAGGRPAAAGGRPAAAGGRPAAAGGRPAEQGGRPEGGRPAWQRPAWQRPAWQRPAWQRPAEQGGRPEGGRPAEQGAGQRPAEQGAGQRPAEQRPAWRRPAEQRGQAGRSGQAAAVETATAQARVERPRRNRPARTAEGQVARGEATTLGA